MLFLLGLFVFASAEKATDICLPETHQSWVSTSRWALDNIPDKYSHHYAEYNEGDIMYIWSDGNTRKTLAHVYEYDHYAAQDREMHHFFSLRDYNKKYHWFGQYNFTTQQSTECWLELFDSDHRPWGPYCLAKGANLRGSGTVGESAKVDFWEADYDDPFGNFHEEIDIILEAGSTNYVLQERVDGTYTNVTSGEKWYWAEHREFFDFSTDKIDPSRFAIPIGCPNP